MWTLVAAAASNASWSRAPSCRSDGRVQDELDKVPERLPAQHLAAEDDLPAVLGHAHLAPIRGLVRRRRRLERERLRLVDRASAARPCNERRLAPHSPRRARPRAASRAWWDRSDLLCTRSRPFSRHAIAP